MEPKGDHKATKPIKKLPSTKYVIEDLQENIRLVILPSSSSHVHDGNGNENINEQAKGPCSCSILWLLRFLIPWSAWVVQMQE